MSSDRTQQAPPAINALELLPLPDPEALTDAQRRGKDCVWCGIALNAETARDLGERPAPDGVVMFPRGCGACTRKAAVLVYNGHSRTCEQCVDDPTLCETRRALRRLSLAGR